MDRSFEETLDSFIHYGSRLYPAYEVTSVLALPFTQQATLPPRCFSAGIKPANLQCLLSSCVATILGLVLPCSVVCS